MLPRLFVNLVLLLAFAASSPADELDDLMKRMREQFTAELRSIQSQQPKTAEERMKSQEQEHALMESMARLETAIARGRKDDIEAHRRYLSPALQLQPETRRAMEEVISKAPDLIAKRRASEQHQVEAFLGAARTTILQAKHPDDLAPLWREMDALKETLPPLESSSSRQIGEKLSSAEQTARSWETYLRQKEAGYHGASKLALDQILNQRSAYPLLRVEEVQAELSRADEASRSTINAAKEILRGIRAPADISSAADRIAQLPHTSSADQSQLGNLKSIMNSFAETAVALELGFYDRSGQQQRPSGSHSEWNRELLLIENMLRIELLRKQFSELQLPPPEPDENHADYGKRLMQRAAEQRDWDKLLKLAGRDARYPGIRDPSSRWTEAGLADFIAGKRLEEAGDWASAIGAYRRAIASTGDYVPRDEAAARLKKLTEAHPDAAERAMREEEIREIVKTVIESRMPPGRRDGRPF